MNLKKYTKSELIDKIKNSENSDNKKSIKKNPTKYLSETWNFVLGLKNILLKITLIATIIKIFKKYRFIRVLWLTLNSIVMSIFGISLIENFGFDYITNILREIKYILGNIIEYLTETKFYNSLDNVINSNTDTKIENKNQETRNKDDVIRRIEENKKRNDSENLEGLRKNYKTSKISDWFKNDQEEIIKEEPENNNKPWWIDYRKWSVILGVITASVVVYIYSDEIKENSSSFWEWITSFRSSNSGDNTNNAGSNTKFDNSGDNISNASDTRSYSDDIQMIGPSSLEDLNSEVEDSWSSNSNETVTPSKNKGKSKFLEAISREEEKSPISTPISEITTQNIAEISNTIEREWRSILSHELKFKIDFIERTIRLHHSTGVRETYEKYMKEIKERPIVMKSDSNNSDNLLYKTLFEEKIRKWILDIENQIKD